MSAVLSKRALAKSHMLAPLAAKALAVREFSNGFVNGWKRVFTHSAGAASLDVNAGGWAVSMRWKRLFTLYEVDMESRSNARRRAVMSRLESVMNGKPREAAPDAQPEPESAAAANIDSLDILEVLFILCKSDGLQVAGDPNSAFAHFDSSTRTLYVYARNMNAVDISSDPKTTMLAALDYAQVQGASFEAGDGFAVCTVKGVTAHGHTYGEAAVRALAKLKASLGSQTSTAEANRGS